MERILLVYNPKSGKKSIASHLDKLCEIFATEGKLLTLYRLGSDNLQPLSELIRGGGFDGVVVCGGDGSVNSIVKTMIEENCDLPLGVIPTGTCNDFSRSIGMPGDPMRCARLIAQGNIMHTDIGLIDGGKSVFVNELAGGVIVTASFSTDQNMKKLFGPLAYYVTGLGELANIKPFELKIETPDKTYVEQAIVFLVLNGTDISGFSNIVKDAQMQDGEMDILVFKNVNPLEITDTLFKFVTGGQFKEENVVRIRTPECRISCDADISTTVDGERGPEFPFELKMKKCAIKIFY